MSDVRITQLDGKLPNLALMRLAAFHALWRSRMIAPPILRQDREMSEDWKTAYKTWGDPVEDAAFDLFGKPVQRGFRSGYLAQAETVERLREALERIAGLTTRTPVGAGDGGTYALTGREGIEAAEIARLALADLQPKETR